MPSAVNELISKEIKREFEGAPYAFISSFNGITVADISTLRNDLQDKAKRAMVVKHSIAKRIFTDMDIEGTDKLNDFFSGNVLIAVGEKEPQLISKALVKFAKDQENFKPAGVVFEGKVHDEAYIKSLAKLPTRHELLTQMVIRAKSPISGFVMTLNQLVKGVVVALNEIKKQKEAAPAA